MKSLVKATLLSVFLILAACGSKDKDTANLTPIQAQAVAYVKKHLERREKLEEFQIVEEVMPVSLMEQPFLNLRNTVFKAGLDYQSCKTRGLEAGMQMAQDKISVAREEILATENALNQSIGTTKSLILLGKVKSPKLHDGNLESIVVVFNPETMEANEWIPVTTPVQNTVALVACAQDNTLDEYAREQHHDNAMIASKVSDPVLKFVLEAHAL